MTSFKVISGGQTGVDRAALDAAMKLGIPCGGKCPLGRLAEDGTIPDYYPLDEMPTKEYSARTRANVMESNGTLIVNRGTTLSDGTAFTASIAREAKKLLLVVDLNAPISEAEFVNWMQTNPIQVLNVAGPRESGQPGIQAEAEKLLRQYFQAMMKTN